MGRVNEPIPQPGERQIGRNVELSRQMLDEVASKLVEGVIFLQPALQHDGLATLTSVLANWRIAFTNSSTKQGMAATPISSRHSWNGR